MHDDFYQMYLEELEALTEVGAEEEKILLARLSGGDGDAGKRLIEGNLKKALALAKEYDGKGLPMNDLVQEANMALTALVMELGDGGSPEMRFEELLEKRVRESLQAAVDPANTDYYFYALDTDGTHHFSSTYYDHQAFLESLQGA